MIRISELEYKVFTVLDKCQQNLSIWSVIFTFAQLFGISVIVLWILGFLPSVMGVLSVIVVVYVRLIIWYGLVKYVKEEI